MRSGAHFAPRKLIRYPHGADILGLKSVVGFFPFTPLLSLNWVHQSPYIAARRARPLIPARAGYAKTGAIEEVESSTTVLGTYPCPFRSNACKILTDDGFLVWETTTTPNFSNLLGSSAEGQRTHSAFTE